MSDENGALLAVVFVVFVLWVLYQIFTTTPIQRDGVEERVTHNNVIETRQFNDHSYYTPTSINKRIITPIQHNDDTGIIRRSPRSKVKEIPLRWTGIVTPNPINDVTLTAKLNEPPVQTQQPIAKIYEEIQQVRICREDVNHNGFEFGNWCGLNDYNVDEVVPFIESGVYELGILGKKIVACYVGMTGHLNERLRTHHRGVYTDKNGNKWDNNTTYAIETNRNNGYNVLFRVLLTKSRGEASQIENALLSKYDYAWNILDNSKDYKRKIKGF